MASMSSMVRIAVGGGGLGKGAPRERGDEGLELEVVGRAGTG